MNCTVHGVAKSQTEQLSLVFVNKALLEHSHTHSFAYHLWLLSLTTAELSGCQGTQWVVEADVFYYLTPIESYRKLSHCCLR